MIQFFCRNYVIPVQDFIIFSSISMFFYLHCNLAHFEVKFIFHYIFFGGGGKYISNIDIKLKKIHRMIKLIRCNAENITNGLKIPCVCVCLLLRI